MLYAAAEAAIVPNYKGRGYRKEMPFMWLIPRLGILAF
jgi:hypothetical protein